MKQNAGLFTMKQLNQQPDRPSKIAIDRASIADKKQILHFCLTKGSLRQKYLLYIRKTK